MRDPLWLERVVGGNACEGPYKRTRPYTLTFWMRMRRALRKWLRGW